MAIIYLKHPKFGAKVAIAPEEAAQDKRNGWVEFDPKAQRAAREQAAKAPETPAAPAAPVAPEAPVVNALPTRRRRLSKAVEPQEE